MSVTLGDYARQQYPGHSTDTWRGVNPPLVEHTVVAHVVGREKAERTIDLLEQSLAADEVAAVLVLGTGPTILPTTHEDRDGPADLPDSRIVLGAAAGCVIGLLAVVGISIAWHLPWEAEFALMFFFAGAGAYGGTLSAGAARHAAERAVTQLHAPGEDIGVVAALVDGEAPALAIADHLTSAGIHDVRIVSCDGGWHAPA